MYTLWGLCGVVLLLLYHRVYTDLATYCKYLFKLGCAGIDVQISDFSVTYEDCCLKYIKKVKPRIQKYAVSYRLQVLDGGCNLPAVM